jgi:hypothetical protein
MLAWGKDCELRTSKPQPQVMRANPFFPAAIWRRRPLIAAGNAFLVFLYLGFHQPRCRSLDSPQATCRRCSAAKKTPHHHSTKPDALQVLAAVRQDKSWPTICGYNHSQGVLVSDRSLAFLLCTDMTCLSVVESVNLKTPGDRRPVVDVDRVNRSDSW